MLCAPELAEPTSSWRGHPLCWWLAPVVPVVEDDREEEIGRGGFSGTRYIAWHISRHDGEAARLAHPLADGARQIRPGFSDHSARQAYTGAGNTRRAQAAGYQGDQRHFSLLDPLAPA
jgi:hypothetical protein